MGNSSGDGGSVGIGGVADGDDYVTSFPGGRCVGTGCGCRRPVGRSVCAVSVAGAVSGCGVAVVAAMCVICGAGYWCVVVSGVGSSGWDVVGSEDSYSVAGESVL